MMKPVKILVLAVAALAAVTLAVLVRGMISGKPTSQAAAAVPPPPRQKLARVLVAKRDLKVGERIAAEDLDWQDWPIQALNPAFTTDGSGAAPVAPPIHTAAQAPAKSGTPASTTKIGRINGAVSSPDAVTRVTHAVAMLGDGGPKAQFMGAVVRQPFLKGEPIVAAKVVRAGESGYLAVLLPPGMRAMAVPVKVETAAGGFILPGDRVDVILSRRMSDAGHGDQFSSATVLRNIKVLAIDQVAQADKDETTVVGATATLQVGAEESEALALAKSEGDLSLTLRSYADIGQPTGRAGPTARESSAQFAQASAGVRVFRNGEVTEVQVRP